MSRSNLPLLLEYQAELLDVIGGSTLAEPIRDAAGAFLARALSAADGRAQAALLRSAERSYAVRAGIRDAAGALPSAPEWGAAGVIQRRISLRGPERYGLARIPDIETIRAELREKLREQEPEPAPMRASTA